MATLSIDIPASAVPRIRAALRNQFPSGLDPETGQPYTDPTDQELLARLKDMVRQFVRREVRDYESRQAEEQARAAIIDIDIT